MADEETAKKPLSRALPAAAGLHAVIMQLRTVLFHVMNAWSPGIWAKTARRGPKSAREGAKKTTKNTEKHEKKPK